MKKYNTLLLSFFFIFKISTAFGFSKEPNPKDTLDTTFKVYYNADSVAKKGKTPLYRKSIIGRMSYIGFLGLIGAASVNDKHLLLSKRLSAVSAGLMVFGIFPLFKYERLRAAESINDFLGLNRVQIQKKLGGKIINSKDYFFDDNPAWSFYHTKLTNSVRTVNLGRQGSYTRTESNRTDRIYEFHFDKHGKVVFARFRFPKGWYKDFRWRESRRILSD